MRRLLMMDIDHTANTGMNVKLERLRYLLNSAASLLQRRDAIPLQVRRPGALTIRYQHGDENVPGLELRKHRSSLRHFGWL